MENRDETTLYNESKSHLQGAAKYFIAENDGDHFLISAQECLENGQQEALLEVLRDPENSELLGFVGWDLAKMVFQLLPDNCRKLEKSDTRKTLLYLICNSCNPREICLSLSEVLSEKLHWEKLVVLLSLLSIICSRLKGKIRSILMGIFSSIQRCFKNRNDHAEHEEILENTLEFVNTLMEKIQNKFGELSDEAKVLKEGLLSFLISLLEHPFTLLEFKIKSENQDKHFTRNDRFAKTILTFLGILENGSLKRLFEYGFHHENKAPRDLESSDDDDVDGLSFIGIGCLSFLTHVQGIGAEFVPVVTTGKYSLDTNMVYINALLCFNNAKVISKGLRLLIAISNLIETDTLDHCYIDNKEFSTLFTNMRNLMIHSEVLEIRQESVKGFRNILSRLNPRGRYRLLRTFHKGEIQSGFAELLTLILKDEIARSLENGVGESWFLGDYLASFLLENIFKIPSKALQSEFGVIEHCNGLLAALNLLRFLLIKDDMNKTTIHTIFPKLEDSFLKQLRNIVELSRARIGVLVQDKQQEKKRGVSAQRTASDETIFNVTTPNGSKLERGSLQEQLEMLQSACLTLDMIESVLARIGEIRNDKRTKM